MANETKKIDWAKVWSFVKGKTFLGIVVVVLIAFASAQCSSLAKLKREKITGEQNRLALTDSLKQERKKNGESLVTIAGYVSTEKELKSLNRDLWERIKGQDGQIVSLNHTVLRLVQDTTVLKKYLEEKTKLIEKLLKIDDSTFVAPWTLTYRYDSTNYDVFTGKTYIGITCKDPLELSHLDTKLTERSTQIDLTWGQKVEKDKLRVFVQSSYPGFTVAQMEGVLIDPNSNPFLKSITKKKHWFTGFSVGIGAAGGYNVTDGKYGLVFGPTVAFNVYTF